MIDSIHTDVSGGRPLAGAIAAAALLVACLPVTAEAHGPGGHGGDHGAADPHAAHRAPAVSPGEEATTGVRVEVPDVELVDQDGQRVRLRELVAGRQPVVVDFVYTTCTTVCPVLSAIMSRIQARLGDRVGPEVRLVSISVDPVRDTPARLKAYSAKHKAGRGWTWLTGERQAIESVLRAMGSYSADVVDHPPMILVGQGATGTWTRFNGFPDQELVLARVDELALSAQPRTRADSEREAKARAYFTDTVLLDQHARPVRFYEDVLRDQVVVLSFMFTRCTDACPLLANKLNQVRRELGPAFGRDVRFVSISVDPEHDSPRELGEFLRKQDAVHPAWSFLTGKKDDVEHVVKKLGERVEGPGDHSTGFIAGNVRTGHWARIRPDVPPAAIAEMTRQLVAESAGEAASAASASGT